MSMVTPKKSAGSKPFNRLDEVLVERGYPKIKAKRAFYHVYDVAAEFPLYVHKGNFGSNKLFIDAQHADLAKVLSAIKGILPPVAGTTKNSSFERFSSRGVQFLTGLPEREGWRFQFKDAEAVRKFLDVCEAYASAGLAAATKAALVFEQVIVRPTIRQSTVAARVGQDKFRDKVIRYWKACAVTGCELTSILKASHIKPWAVSDALERLDASNGILLSPNLDCLFDAGFISFDEKGGILISADLNAASTQALGLSPAMRLKKLNSAILPYLEYHREHVFRG